MKISARLGRSAAALAVAGAALAASACGSTGSAAAVSYAPAAYGVSVGHNFDCYYIESPAEVADLISAGLCPHGSVATPMPVTWEETYWSYYSSPAYYNVYMPANYRRTYTSVYVIHFKTTYSKQITADASHGTYKSSTGKTVTGNSAAKLTFGSGTSKTTTVRGGGAGRAAGSCSLPMNVLADKGSTTTSRGGGSGRSGTSSGTKTTTKTGSSTTHGGC